MTGWQMPGEMVLNMAADADRKTPMGFMNEDGF